MTPSNTWSTIVGRRRPDGADRAGGGRARRRAAGVTEVTRDVAADAVQKKAIVYDRQGDAHYDVISAFIKSIRGSDPDAALFWLARMIEAGEDPRFIARRLIVHASEDIGLADPRPARRHRRRPRRRARGAARGAPEPGARPRSTWRRPRSPTACTRPLASDGGRRSARAGAAAPERRQLPGRPAARPRRGLPLPPRLPGTPWSRSTAPPGSRARRYYEPSGQGRSHRRRRARSSRSSRIGRSPARLRGRCYADQPQASRRRHEIADAPGDVGGDTAHHRSSPSSGPCWSWSCGRAAQHVPRAREHEDDDRHDARGDRAAPARGPGNGGADQPRARPGRRDAGLGHRDRGPGREALRPGRTGRGEPAREDHQLGRRPEEGRSSQAAPEGGRKQ